MTKKFKVKFQYFLWGWELIITVTSKHEKNQCLWHKIYDHFVLDGIYKTQWRDVILQGDILKFSTGYCKLTLKAHKGRNWLNFRINHKGRPKHKTQASNLLVPVRTFTNKACDRM